MMSNPWSGALYGAVGGLALSLLPSEAESQKTEDKE